jgi:hypothetical protein
MKLVHLKSYCLFYKMQIESELKSYYHFKNTPPS